MGLSEVLILVMAVAGFAVGYLAAVLRHGDTKVGNPSASTNNARDEICACNVGATVRMLRAITSDNDIVFCWRCGCRLSPVA